MNTYSRTEPRIIRALGIPLSGRGRLIRLTIFWSLAALIEAFVYIGLTIAIRDRQAPPMVLVLATLALVVTVLVARAGFLTGARWAGDLYATMGQTLARAKIAWFTATRHELITRAAGQSIPALMAIPAHLLQTLVLSSLIPIVLVIGVIWTHGIWWAVTIFVLTAAAFFAQVISQRFLARSDAVRHQAETVTAQRTIEFVEHLELLRAAAGPHAALSRLADAWDNHEQAVARTTRAASRAVLISGLARFIPLAGTVIGLALTDGYTQPLIALALIVMVLRISGPVDQLALVGLDVSTPRQHGRAYRDTLSASPLPDTTVPGVTPQDATITIADLSYGSVLHDISARIPPGSCVHVTGVSGAGKSTLLGLLLRFDDPTTGQICLGGAPLSTLSPETIYHYMSYVPQHPVIFTGTLADNVRLARPNASDAQIRVALHAAQLDTLVDSEEYGINQEIGVHGAALSGGEQQRLALARALITDSPILILDEATSALDATTEQRIAQELRSSGKTLIIVTHREPTIWHPTYTIMLSS